MKRINHAMAVAAAVTLLAAAPTQAQTVSGTVTYTGAVPKLRPVAMDADPMCAHKHKGPVENEMLVLGPGNTMANILVSVVSGLPAGKTWPAPKEPVVMDQKGCQYFPHVMGVMVGQPFKILNSDGLLHNVHSLSKVNKSFNMAMPASRTEATETFKNEEDSFVVKCDVHPWMQAFVRVLSHPFYAVTKADGKFTIKGLPAGTYELEAWHEKLPKQKASVTVAASGTQTVDFKFAAPSK